MNTEVYNSTKSIRPVMSNKFLLAYPLDFQSQNILLSKLGCDIDSKTKPYNDFVLKFNQVGAHPSTEFPKQLKTAFNDFKLQLKNKIIEPQFEKNNKITSVDERLFCTVNTLIFCGTTQVEDVYLGCNYLLKIIYTDYIMGDKNFPKSLPSMVNHDIWLTNVGISNGGSEFFMYVISKITSLLNRELSQYSND